MRGYVLKKIKIYGRIYDFHIHVNYKFVSPSVTLYFDIRILVKRFEGIIWNDYKLKLLNNSKKKKYLKIKSTYFLNPSIQNVE